MAFIAVLVLSLVCQCWTAPYRRNWTPQAMLYLKGAQRHRSVVERRSNNAAALPDVMYRESNDDELRISPRIFNLLRMIEQGGIDPYDYLHDSL
ncbi:spexin prohormone 1-like [Boleophthalmus pectinirostris]|uniref:spexin prohormone 1-like n=1 Tax=Boleophthalmus pectinirostris TaxID=150288 RepID=UPI002432FD70|nr:spexin prohormone 1-like [Boleophthalmus pectinirostris]